MRVPCALEMFFVFFHDGICLVSETNFTAVETTEELFLYWQLPYCHNVIYKTSLNTLFENRLMSFSHSVTSSNLFLSLPHVVYTHVSLVKHKTCKAFTHNKYLDTRASKVCYDCCSSVYHLCNESSTVCKWFALADGARQAVLYSALPACKLTQ